MDDIEAALQGVATDFPILNSIDPYGTVTITRGRLAELQAECRQLLDVTPNDRAVLEKIAELCQRGLAASVVHLSFEGD